MHIDARAFPARIRKKPKDCGEESVKPAPFAYAKFKSLDSTRGRFRKRIPLKNPYFRSIGFFLVLVNSTPSLAQNRVGLLQPIATAEFLRLTEEIQTIYVSGILEGIAFMGYSYAPDDYPAWTECVRKKTLGETTKDVVAFIQQGPKFNEGVASAVAQSLGRRCKR